MLQLGLKMISTSTCVEGKDLLNKCSYVRSDDSIAMSATAVHLRSSSSALYDSLSEVFIKISTRRKCASNPSMTAVHYQDLHWTDSNEIESDASKTSGGGVGWPRRPMLHICYL
jgi:hypothetical protein